MLDLARPDQVLNVGALHKELVALAEAHDATVLRDDLAEAVLAHPDLHVHVLGSLCIRRQVERLLALGRVSLHVSIEDLVVPVEVLLLGVVQLLHLLLRHHQPDLPPQLLYPLEPEVQVGEQAPPVAVHQVVVEAQAGRHLPSHALEVRVLGDQALHLPCVVQDLLHHFLDHLVVELREPACPLQVFQQLHGLLHVENHGAR
mmetsp:Transcript_30802/g.70114  ORF Transcript_30802/g.70114 Transcript_30802/m.70114 type:complete len:202 (+) Transcript_30802:177-782(+)